LGVGVWDVVVLLLWLWLYLTFAGLYGVAVVVHFVGLWLHLVDVGEWSVVVLLWLWLYMWIAEWCGVVVVAFFNRVHGVRVWLLCRNESVLRCVMSWLMVFVIVCGVRDLLSLYVSDETPSSVCLKRSGHAAAR